MELNMRPLWNAQLEVYSAIEAVCRAMSIRYWAGYGTVLGAMRHGGFIPWDDDIDLIFPLPEWIRFKEVAPRLLPEHLKLVTPENTPGFDFNYIKVSDTRREVIDSVARESGHPLSGGVNIDLFPLVGIPSRTIARKCKEVALRSVKNWRLATQRETFSSKAACVVGALLAPFFPSLRSNSDFRALAQRLQEEVPVEEADFVGLYDLGLMSFKEAAPASCFKGKRMVPFSGIEIPVPVETEIYLEWQYGNWKVPKPPPNTEYYHARTTPQPWKYGPAVK